MTWLLNQIQRLLSLLTRGRLRTDASAPTMLGNEIASRLQQSNRLDSELDGDAPIAIRERSHAVLPLGQNDADVFPTAAQSTAPLRHKSSSALKDTIDPVAKEPDTHRRLDIAPAAKPGGAPAVPSFPTDVSDLLSASSTLKQTQPSDSSPSADGLLVPSVEPPVSEQLPEIHDLLPAIDPEDSRESLASGSVESPEQLDDELLDNQQLDRALLSEQSLAQDDQAVFATESENSSATLQAMADVPIVESARRVSNQTLSSQAVSNQAVSHQEISNPEVIEPEVSHQEMDATEGVTLFSFDIVEHSNAEVSESRIDTDDVLSSDGVLEPVDCSDVDDISSSRIATNTSDSRNPWLEAQQSKSSLMESETLLTKSGTVKLLFKLKSGNFHGYIAPEDGSKDILFHQKYINAEIFEDLERGQRVTVTAKQLEGKVYATHVALLQE